MKKIGLLLLGLSAICTIGSVKASALEEEITITPYEEFKNEELLENNGLESAETYSENERAVATPTVTYRTHVQDIGWQGWKSNAQVAGTSGKSKRLEAIQLKLQGSAYTGDIQYRTHIQDIGWQGWKKNGQVSGTSGQKKRLEAIQIKLTGQLAQKYDVFYRVHAQEFGWMGWEKGGLPSGTAKYSYRLEAIEVKLVPKKNYFVVNKSAKMSFRENKKYPGELDYKKLGVPKSYLHNGLKLFKDEKSLNSFVMSVLNDPNRKAIECNTYVITQRLKIIGYSAEFLFPY